MEQQTAAMLSLVDVLRNGVFLPVGLSKFSLSVYKVQNHGQRPAPGSVMAKGAVSEPWTGIFTASGHFTWRPREEGEG